MITAICALSAAAFAPAVPARGMAPVRAPPVVMSAPAYGRRAALLAIAALPTLQAHADAVEEIAARNAAALEAERAAKAAKAAEGPEDNTAAIALVGGIAAVGTAVSLAPVSKNVERVGKKIVTGKNQRKY